MPVGTEKIAGLWFAGRDQCPGWQYGHNKWVQLFFSINGTDEQINGDYIKNSSEIEFTLLPYGKNNKTCSKKAQNQSIFLYFSYYQGRLYSILLFLYSKNTIN